MRCLPSARGSHEVHAVSDEEFIVLDEALTFYKEEFIVLGCIHASRAVCEKR